MNFARKLSTLLRSFHGVEMDGAPGLSYAGNSDGASTWKRGAPSCRKERL